MSIGNPPVWRRLAAPVTGGLPVALACLRLREERVMVKDGHGWQNTEGDIQSNKI